MKDYYQLKGHVSNTSLNLLEKSSREFRKFLYEDYEEKPQLYYDFGTAMHMYLLEPKLFDKEIMVLDYEVPKSKQQVDFCKKYAEKKKVSNSQLKDIFLSTYKATDKWEEKAKQLARDHKNYIKFLRESKNKTIISSKTMRTIRSIAEEVKHHKMASKLLSEDSIIDDGILRFSELQILWDYKGIKCKSMLDRVVIDKNKKIVYLVDLKSTKSILEFKSSFERYNYHRQLSFYGMALATKLEELANLTEDELLEYQIVGVIIAIDKITSEVKVFKISEKILNKALPEVTSLLERAKWHIDNNKYDYSREYYEGEGFDSL